MAQHWTDVQTWRNVTTNERITAGELITRNARYFRVHRVSLCCSVYDIRDEAGQIWTREKDQAAANG